MYSNVGWRFAQVVATLLFWPFILFVFNLKGLATKIPEGYKFHQMLLFSLYKVTSLFFLGWEQREETKHDFVLEFLDIVLPLFFLILKELLNKDTQKEFVPGACFSLIAFFSLREALLEEWLQALLCKEIIQVNLYFIILIFFNLRQDYSNLLCMKENMRKLNTRYIPIYLSARTCCVKSIDDFLTEFSLNFLFLPHHLDLLFSYKG